jgi:hypothetical protein
MMCGATTGHKQSAGHEYECDGFFHGMIHSASTCILLICSQGFSRKLPETARLRWRQDRLMWWSGWGLCGGHPEERAAPGSHVPMRLFL